jgi:hypothetical protein
MSYDTRKSLFAGESAKVISSVVLVTLKSNILLLLVTLKSNALLLLQYVSVTHIETDRYLQFVGLTI